MKNYKKAIPNILTLINLSLGVVAIILSTQANNGKSVNALINASLLILVAALTDRFDGKAARHFNVVSDLGKELDSLSDLISFGVAPIIITWKISFCYLGPIGYILSVIFPIAGAYRLARYNVTPFDNIFQGIPITIAGLFLTIVNLYNTFFLLTKNTIFFNHYFMIIFVIGLSFLMVSKFSIKKM